MAHAQQFEIPASAKAAIIDQTNAYRQSKGLAPLSENEDASREAQAYADYLAKTARGGHSADGRNPVQRLRAGSVKFCKFRGENWHMSWTRPVRASPDTAMNAPCASGRNLRGMSAHSGRARTRSVSVLPALSTAISGGTRRSRCSSTPLASRAPRLRRTLALRGRIKRRRCLAASRFRLCPTVIPCACRTLECSASMR